MNKVVLLDRDGVVIMDPGKQVTSEDDIKLFPDTLSALKKLAESGFSAVLITNQSAIAGGKISRDDFERINAEVIRQLKPSGIKILKTYVCPHAMDAGCDCRKPKSKMLLDAAKDFELDLSKTFMLGDRPKDVHAGRAAGARTILVRTARVQGEAPEADFQADSLTEAVDYVIANS